MIEPLVSVILPTYNRASYLAEALDSVRRQTYQRWELVVIDDGSTDDTPDALARITDPRHRTIRLAHSNNPAAVRNAGLAVARGRYVAFLDDDDLWSAEKLATQVAGLCRSACRWGYTGFRRIDSAGRDLPDETLRPWHPYKGWILEPLLRIDAIVPLPTVMAERTLLVEAGGFDEALRDCEDYELWFRLSALSAVHVDEAALACIRVHSEHRQADRARVNAAWIAVYRKTANAVRDPRLKALCLRRRGEHEVLLARLLLDRGGRWASLGLLARAGPRVGTTPAWWKVLARAVLPGTLVRVLRVLRR